MLHLYSDASCDMQTRLGVASTLILDDDERVCYAFICKVYGNVTDTSYAELLGIAQGLDWLVEHMPDAEYTLLSDRIDLLERICLYPKDVRVTNGPPATLRFHIYNTLDKLRPPVTVHISSHQSEHNPNKACDMLCSRVMAHVRGD